MSALNMTMKASKKIPEICVIKDLNSPTCEREHVYYELDELQE